jgi:hypothetical protein
LGYILGFEKKGFVHVWQVPVERNIYREKQTKGLINLQTLAALMKKKVWLQMKIFPHSFHSQTHLTNPRFL